VRFPNNRASRTSKRALARASEDPGTQNMALRLLPQDYRIWVVIPAKRARLKRARAEPGSSNPRAEECP
jgi:hypothetical protein